MSRHRKLQYLSRYQKGNKTLLSISPFLALALPYYYLIGIIALILISILVIRLVKTCYSCECKAKQRPHKVRLIAYSKRMIYLEAGKQEEEIFDTPFVSYQYVPDTAEETAQKMIDQRFCGIKRAKPHQLINYCYQDKEQGISLLIHLFVVHINNPNELYIDCKPSEGKWWDIKHLNSPHIKSLLSPAIKEELPCLKETILLAHSLCKK